MHLTNVSLAANCQENVPFPWLANETAKKTLNLLSGQSKLLRKCSFADLIARHGIYNPWRLTSTTKKTTFSLTVIFQPLREFLTAKAIPVRSYTKQSYHIVIIYVYLFNLLFQEKICYPVHCLLHTVTSTM
jgi:hypothetical protein